MAVTGLAREFGRWDKLKNYPALDPRRNKHKGFDVAVYVASFLFCFCNGGKSIADAERINEDEALKELLGFKRFPDQSALGDWLRNIGEAGVGKLRLLLRSFTEVGTKARQARSVAPCGNAGSVL